MIRLPLISLLVLGFAGAAQATPCTGSCAVNVDQIGPVASIKQTGSNNTANVTQRGAASTASVTQTGSSLQASINQTASARQSATVVQQGAGNAMSLVQSGVAANTFNSTQ